MAIRIGITGGIGSGKSVVSKILSLLDIPIYLSDDEAKRLTATDEAIRRKLTDLLGDELYQGGMLNKQKLANFLFASADNAEKINAIIHPQVSKISVAGVRAIRLRNLLPWSRPSYSNRDLIPKSMLW